MGSCNTKDQQPKTERVDLQKVYYSKIKKICPSFSDKNQQHVSQIGNPDFKKLIFSLPQQFYNESFSKSQLSNKALTKPQVFLNWCGNIAIGCQNIFYPFKSDSEQVNRKNQIEVIQQFVRQAASRGKRVRGSAMRHSFSNTFSDPNQLMVSFYPSNIVNGTTNDLYDYAIQMEELQKQMEENLDATQHLCMIRYKGYDEGLKKHLVKIGASVSNQQLRRWCKRKNLQYITNVVTVETNFCGASLTFGHGSSINIQTMADYINQIQFIDFLGDRQKISKRSNPQLLSSAASSLGLLGLVIFLTVQMDSGHIVKLQHRKAYKDDVIPYPAGWQKSAKFMNNRIQERKKHNFKDNLSWKKKYDRFCESFKKSYTYYFYYPLQQKNIYELTGSIYSQTNLQSEKHLKNIKAAYEKEYPSFLTEFASKLTYRVANFLLNNENRQNSESLSVARILMKNPFIFFPQKQIFLANIDSLHYQRGMHNFKIRCFSLQINIPTINENLDYDLIQRIWWTALLYSEKFKDKVNLELEMSFYKGSECTLAMQRGFQYVCQLGISSRLVKGPSYQNWQKACEQIFDQIRKLKDEDGRTVILRPHWGKQWSQLQNIKKRVLEDEGVKQNFKKFWEDYQQIAKVLEFDAKRNLQTFQTKLLMQLIRSAVPNFDPEQQKSL